jgi:hypothetical protein
MTGVGNRAVFIQEKLVLLDPVKERWGSAYGVVLIYHPVQEVACSEWVICRTSPKSKTTKHFTATTSSPSNEEGGIEQRRGKGNVRQTHLVHHSLVITEERAWTADDQVTGFR